MSAANEDIIFISDLDELPDKNDFPEIITKLKTQTKKDKFNSNLNVSLTSFFNLFITPGLSFKNKFFRKINRIIENIIPNKRVIELKHKWYYYYLNGYANTSQINTRVCTYETLLTDLKGKPNNSRNIYSGNIINSGWHFSYLEDNSLKLKSLADSEDNRDRIEFVCDKKIPIIIVPIDQSFPKYIQKNQEKYKHLIGVIKNE
jgi:hypothetical protein